MSAQLFIDDQDALESGLTAPLAFGVLSLAGDQIQGGPIGLSLNVDLPTALDVAIYEETRPLDPNNTETQVHSIVEAFALSTLEANFPGTVTLTYQYSAPVSTRECDLALFEFNWGSGTWDLLNATQDMGNNLFTARVSKRSLIGLGEIPVPPAPILLPLPLPWDLLRLGGSLGAGVGAVWLMRKRKLLMGAAGALILFVSLPQATSLTTSNCRPVNYAKRIVGPLNQIPGMVGGQAVTLCCLAFDVCKYDGSGNAKLRSNWTCTNAVQYVVDGSLDMPLPIPGATPIPGYDKNTDAFYDCAGHALLGDTVIPLDPDGDAGKIIEDDYDCKGPATGCGYKVGDVVTYKKNGKITHYAVVCEVDDQGKIKKLRSKWGKGRKYKHGLTNVPAGYGAADQCYRKKVKCVEEKKHKEPADTGGATGGSGSGNGAGADAESGKSKVEASSDSDPETVITVKK